VIWEGRWGLEQSNNTAHLLARPSRRIPGVRTPRNVVVVW
jgi:hypothetical protein